MAFKKTGDIVEPLGNLVLPSEAPKPEQSKEVGTKEVSENKSNAVAPAATPVVHSPKP